MTAYIYYNGKNRAEDPRIVQTKYMFRQFDELMKENKFSSALPLADSIEIILLRVPGYTILMNRESYINNRGSAYLSMALYTTNRQHRKNSGYLESAKRILIHLL